MGWTVAGLAKQVNRLRALPRGEDERPWKILAPEYERILGRVGEDDAHLERIIDHVLDHAAGESRFCPTPAELANKAEEVSASIQPLRADPNCVICDGTGWKRVERGGLTGVDRCSCMRRAA